MTESIYGKRQYVLSSSTWTPIVLPFSCNYVNFRNVGANDIQYSTMDPSVDATQYDTLSIGTQDSVSVFWPVFVRGKYRFPIGMTLIWAKGASTLICTFVI